MCEGDYPNATLHAEGLSVVVFLPDATRGYYRASRFDASSMIGCVRLDAPSNASGAVAHELFGNALWRVPHDPAWTEAGVGLASEFGCGDDGAVCWGSWSAERDAEAAADDAASAPAPIANGVLGHDAAADGAWLPRAACADDDDDDDGHAPTVTNRHGSSSDRLSLVLLMPPWRALHEMRPPGEPFLKIGVGKLVKGSCAACGGGGSSASDGVCVEPSSRNDVDAADKPRPTTARVSAHPARARLSPSLPAGESANPYPC